MNILIFFYKIEIYLKIHLFKLNRMDNFINKKRVLNKTLERIAITCGDAGENHQGMSMEGNLGEEGTGFTITDLKNIKKYLEERGKECEYIDLYNTKEAGLYNTKEAGVLILRNYISEDDIQKLYDELTSVEWDTKYYDTRRQKVLNKNARENLLFLKGKSQEPDYENKKGRIVDINSLPQFNLVLDNLFEIINKETNGKATNLIAEGNRYLKQKIVNNKLKKVNHGIGWHGDAERRKVICISIGGKNFPMYWQWFYKHKPINDKPFKILLNSGDIYIMSEEAVGQKWKNSSQYTLRHCAGHENFTKYKKEWIEYLENKK